MRERTTLNEVNVLSCIAIGSGSHLGIPSSDPISFLHSCKARPVCSARLWDVTGTYRVHIFDNVIVNSSHPTPTEVW